MKVKKPNHATVVAYVALFVALGGTAIAAQSYIGAKELKPLTVRKDRATPSDTGRATAVARCKKNEQFVSGAGGWSREDSTNPTISTVSAITTGQRPKGIVVRGDAPALNNRLVAQAICLPK